MTADQATVAEEEYLQIIFWLEEAKLPITGANIARAMQLSPPTVHEMVGRLEGDGYVSRAEDKTIEFTDKGRERGRGDRPPPPADRALPHRRPRHPLGRGPRGGRAPRARDVAGARGAHARRDRRRQDLPPRPPDRRGRPRGGRSARRRRAGRQGPHPPLRERGRGAPPLPQGLGPEPGPRGRARRARTTPRSSSPRATGSTVVSRSVAETVSVRADPAPAPRAPLPEQLVLSATSTAARPRRSPRVRSERPGEPLDALGDLVGGDRGEREAQARPPPSIMKSGPATKVTPSSLASLSSSAVSTSSFEVEPQEVAAAGDDELRLGDLLLERRDQGVAPLASAPR